MKQRITVEQINELSDEQRKRLQEWWNPDINDVYTSTDKNMLNQATVFTIEEIDSSGFIYDWRFGVAQYKNDCMPLLSIGQLIELTGATGILKFNGGWALDEDAIEYHKELVDALWEEVKKVL